VLWNGEPYGAPEGKAVARLRFRDRATLISVLRNPEMGFGDGYARGTLEVEGDLVGLLVDVFRARGATGPAWWLAGLATRTLRRNTRRGSRDHVQHHYDLGNDFYALWLDDRMVYTCAYFPSPDLGLEDAQLAKMDHVCRKLRLRPGERVVEAGCGWGALALHMATHYGVRVRAFNISPQQVRFARERAKELGLVGRVEFVEDDYRSITGRYDAFVSVGMLEHVGRQNYRELGRVMDRCLGSDGRGLLHSIGRARPLPFSPWIEKRIFPGTYPPTLKEMVAIFEPHDFGVLDVENLRPHYARTLEHWLERFEGHREVVRQRFDDCFVRAWRLYLAGSIAAFRTGSLHLYQLLFARTANNDVPWTRRHLHPGV
jgi:cyclopropane-fatty-acyl-phospholipid synthase